MVMKIVNRITWGITGPWINTVLRYICQTSEHLLTLFIEKWHCHVVNAFSDR